MPRLNSIEPWSFIIGILKSKERGVSMWVLHKKYVLFLLVFICCGIGVMGLALGHNLKSTLENSKEVALDASATPAEAKTQPSPQEIPVSSSKEGEEKEKNNFVEYRLEREKTRGQQLEMLREVIQVSGTDSETGRQAREQLLALGNDMTKEAEIENLMRAKGYADVAVYVDLQGVMVMMQGETIPESDETMLKDMVSRCSGVDVQQVLLIVNPS